MQRFGRIARLVRFMRGLQLLLQRVALQNRRLRVLQLPLERDGFALGGVALADRLLDLRCGSPRAILRRFERLFLFSLRVRERLRPRVRVPPDTVELAAGSVEIVSNRIPLVVGRIALAARALELASRGVHFTPAGLELASETVELAPCRIQFSVRRAQLAADVRETLLQL